MKFIKILFLLAPCMFSFANAQTSDADKVPMPNLGWEISAQTSAAAFSDRLVQAAKERLSHFVTYDGSYLRIDYPNGDVPSNIGVCTDVVIRSYRALNIDLQQLVHEDMKANFDSYPSQRIWGLNKPDTNIDHRRVPNLQTFFNRHGVALPVSNKAQAYLPGDIVSWMLSGNLPHIGIVVDEKSPITGQYMIVHNIGRGPKMEDILFAHDITGHYRFDGDVKQIEN